MLSDLMFRLRALCRRKSVEAELDEELRFHFEGQVEKHVQSGLTREEALRRARLEFGGLDQVKEECRDARGVRLLEALWRDIRYSIRLLLKKPATSAAMVFLLALGIGAGGALFTIIDCALLHALPYKDFQRMVAVFQLFPREKLESPYFSAAEYFELRDLKCVWSYG